MASVAVVGGAGCNFFYGFLAELFTAAPPPLFYTTDMANQYGPKAKRKISKTMHEFKRGTLKSSSGDKVTNRKQAVAIGLSKAREAGAKVPPKRG